LAFYSDKQLFLEGTKLRDALSLTILSFTVDSSELFYLILIFYFECLVRSQPESSPLYTVPLLHIKAKEFHHTTLRYFDQLDELFHGIRATGEHARIPSSIESTLSYSGLSEVYPQSGIILPEVSEHLM